jgi:FAD-dependent halogenase
MPDTREYDLIVIGGGPGGSTAAAFVAMQRHRVLLLEKERFPIHKIGESLLPSTVNGICAMLGITEQLRQANFVKKYGGTFIWGRSREPWTFAFSMSSSIAGPTSFAYQVERMKFDTMLLDNARSKGVDVRERQTVVDLLTDGERVVGVTAVDEAGARHELRARYVIDASGWTSTLAQHVGTRVYSQFFRNVAVFGYFRHAKRLPAPNAGNILCVAFDRGWFWFIPLSETLTSVGAVVGQEHVHLLKPSPTTALSGFIEGCAPIRDLLAGADRVMTGPYGEVRVRSDYSYCHTKFWRPGFALIGDAACFIDPVFSSGVHLATYSALLAARSVNTCLRGSLPEDVAFTEFERRYRREYRYFYDFLVAFYNLDQDVESYYWAARKVLNSGDAGNEAFIQLVAGVGGSGEKLYGSGEPFLTHQQRLSDQLNQLSVHRSEKSGVDGRESAGFVTGLLTEATQVQMQAVLKEYRAPEPPLFADGLVPSLDGFHWAQWDAARAANIAGNQSAHRAAG